jgi:molybdate transport system substrate-binding protein
MRHHVIRAVAVVATAFALVVGTAGCSAGHDAGGAGRDTGSTSETPGALRGTVTVFAAASLQQTFTTIGHDFERAHPGTTVRFSFAGSSDLATQIEAGAPADVFAAADQASMAKLPTELLDGTPRAFATNVLEIAVAPGNPLGITGLDDLATHDVQLVTCAAPVPCGAATARVEQAAGVTLHPVSEEQSVTDVLGKVESGQADAGVVYVTDVRGAGSRVTGVPIAAADRAVNTYPIGVLRDAADPALARAFSASVRSSSAGRVLADAGFGKP